jgi:protein involved in plasmid replication-relaxation
VLAVSSHLTDRDRNMVCLVARHRVLTTDQLAALRFSNLTTARHRLSVLVRLGVLRRFRPHRETGSTPWHYVLGPVGATLLGQEDRDERKWAPQACADRQLALERSQRLGHMTRASWFFIALARHARDGGGELRRWDSERDTADFLYNSIRVGSSPHPDGMGIWAEGDRDIAFLLEYDTGTEHLPQLMGKLPDYADLARRAYIAFRMPILFCFPTPRREQTARKALAATKASRDLQIATAALDLRVTSPAGPVWMPLHGGHDPMRLIDLGDVLPDPWRTARQQDERERLERPARADEPGGEYRR